MTDIIGIGAALVDVLARVDEAFLATHKLQKGHMHLIDAAQAVDIDTHLKGERQMVSGGSAANTCVGYALFGGSAAFMGRVNDDAFGKTFAHSITDAGVTYTNLNGTTATTTGVCYSLITADGERTMCTYLGASGDFDKSAINPAMLAGARMLYLEGYIWDTVARAEAADAAITTVRAASGNGGGQIGFSLSDAWVVSKHHATFMHYLDKGSVDVLFANESEILALTKCDTFDAAAVRARTLAKTVVLTCSEKGAMIIQGDKVTHIPAVPVARVIDATGAGDLFAAGFLYGYLNNLSMERAGAIGARVASDVISHIGARPQMDVKKLVA